MVRTDDLQILRLALSPLRHDIFLEVGRIISAIMKLDGEVKDMKVGTPLSKVYFSRYENPYAYFRDHFTTGVDIRRSIRTIGSVQKSRVNRSL